MSKLLTQEEIKDWSQEEIDEKWPEIWTSSPYFSEGEAHIKLELEYGIQTSMRAKWDSKMGLIATRESIIEDLFTDLFAGLKPETIKEIRAWLWAAHRDIEPDLTDEERKISKANNLPYQIEITMPEVKS